MLFRPRCPVEPEEWEWILAGCKWLEREFPDIAASRRLALPTPEYFPPLRTTGPDFADELIGQVQSIAGMAGWPIQLIPVEPLSHDPLNGVAAIQHGKGAAGTFRLLRNDDGALFAEIKYGLDQVSDPLGLVATFAHELSHYLLRVHGAPIPGGDKVEELFTDLTAVWLGFGIFLGNSARYSERNSGWFMSGWRGYLSERMLMTALALSEMLAERDPAAAASFLKDYLQTDLKMAQRYAARRDLREEISNIDLAEYGA